MKNNIKNTSHNKGFTLVELMVAISIFTMIMVMAMGSVLVASNASKKAQSMRTSMDNVNFAMESMTRSIRMGKDYGSDGEQFSFTNSDGDPIKYILTDNILYEDTIKMTSDEVSIEELNFEVKGNSTGDGLQPSVYITMKGIIDVKGEKTSFALQTLVSQRNLEETE